MGHSAALHTDGAGLSEIVTAVASVIEHRKMRQVSAGTSKKTGERKCELRGGFSL